MRTIGEYILVKANKTSKSSLIVDDQTPEIGEVIAVNQKSTLQLGEVVYFGKEAEPLPHSLYADDEESVLVLMKEENIKLVLTMSEMDSSDE